MIANNITIKRINKMKKLIIMLVAMLPFLFVGCSDEDKKNEVNTEPVSLYVDDTYKIPMDITPSSVLSENEFIATIENDGVVSGEHVGETNVLINGEYNVPVEVKGKYNLIEDPITDWGCSASYIKENQKQGTLYSEDEDMIIYTDCGDAEMLGYMMEDGKLRSVGFIISTSYSSEVTNFLTERFFMIPYDLGDYTLGGANAYNVDDATTFAYIQVSSVNYYTVLYVPKELDTKSSNLNIDRLNSISERINKRFYK